MLYTITEMRRYYFIWYEKKLKEKGISVMYLCLWPLFLTDITMF